MCFFPLAVVSLHCCVTSTTTVSMYTVHVHVSQCFFGFSFYLDLPLHGDAEEHDEVHYKYRPEHWHIEGIKKCANHGDDDAFCCRMPDKESNITSVKTM